MRALTQSDLIREACRDAGITILRLEGTGYHLHGAGVDIKVVDLRFLQLRDLKQDQRDRLTGRN